MRQDPADLITPRILIVDDERQIHASVRLRIGRDYDLAFSFEGRDALEKISANRYDLCIADIHMPKMDGLTFISSARQIDPALGYVILSAFDSDENLRRAIPLQVYEFIPKPLPERDAFESLIPQWVERTRRQRKEIYLAHNANSIASDREAALLEREIEYITCEKARSTVRENATYLTTINAHLVSAIAQLSPRLRSDSVLAHVHRNLEEARRASDAAMAATTGYFDSGYGTCDSSPALAIEVLRDAISLVLKICKAEATNKIIDFKPLDARITLPSMPGADFLRTTVPALSAALSVAPANTTVGVQVEHIPRMDALIKDSRNAGFMWFNRRHALNGHSAVIVTISASSPPLSAAQADAWYRGEYTPAGALSSRGTVSGVQSFRGLIGLSLPPQSSQFRVVIALPT
jgi:CheY-like chemotaxis protein